MINVDSVLDAIIIVGLFYLLFKFLSYAGDQVDKHKGKDND